MKSDCENKAEKLEGRRIYNFLVLDKRSPDDLSEEMFSYAQKILFLCEKSFIRGMELMVCFLSELKLQQSLDFDSSCQRRILRQSEGRDGAGQIWQKKNHTFFPDDLKDLVSVLSPQEATTRTELE